MLRSLFHLLRACLYLLFPKKIDAGSKPFPLYLLMDRSVAFSSLLFLTSPSRPSFFSPVSDCSWDSIQTVRPLDYILAPSFRLSHPLFPWHGHPCPSPPPPTKGIFPPSDCVKMPPSRKGRPIFLFNSVLREAGCLGRCGNDLFDLTLARARSFFSSFFFCNQDKRMRLSGWIVP